MNVDTVNRYRKPTRAPTPPANSDLLAGFIRLHVLHHAVHEPPLVGFWMMDELRRHGYRIGAGTMYPLLHGLEKKGYLRSVVKRAGRRSWREYRATAPGRAALAGAREKLKELFHELIEE